MEPTETDGPAEPLVSVEAMRAALREPFRSTLTDAEVGAIALAASDRIHAALRVYFRAAALRAITRVLAPEVVATLPPHLRPPADA